MNTHPDPPDKPVSVICDNDGHIIERYDLHKIVVRRVDGAHITADEARHVAAWYWFNVAVKELATTNLN